MSDFFIRWAETLLNVLVVVVLAGVLIAGVVTMSQPAPCGGFIKGLAIIVGGGLYTCVMAGFLFVIFGIYRNTQETNRLLREQIGR